MQDKIAYGCLSRRRTFAPRSRRVWAAERPARPPPTTMTCAEDIVGWFQNEKEPGREENLHYLYLPALKHVIFSRVIGMGRVVSGIGNSLRSIFTTYIHAFYQHYNVVYKCSSMAWHACSNIEAMLLPSPSIRTSPGTLSVGLPFSTSPSVNISAWALRYAGCTIFSQ